MQELTVITVNTGLLKKRKFQVGNNLKILTSRNLFHGSHCIHDKSF